MYVRRRKMAKAVTSENTVVTPKEEYGFLKELYKTVKTSAVLIQAGRG